MEGSAAEILAGISLPQIHLHSNLYPEFVVALVTHEVIADIRERGLKEVDEAVISRRIKRVLKDLHRVFLSCHNNELGWERSLQRVVGASSYSLIVGNKERILGLAWATDPNRSEGQQTYVAAFYSVTEGLQRIGIEWIAGS